MFLCLVFLMLLRLFIAALWSTAGKGLTSWLLLVMFIEFLLLSHVVSWVKVWNLIVLIPDLCRLSYFYNVHQISVFIVSLFDPFCTLFYSYTSELTAIFSNKQRYNNDCQLVFMLLFMLYIYLINVI